MVSETAFPLLENRLSNSSGVNGNLSALDPHDQWLREGHAKRVEVFLKQAPERIMPEPEITEASIDSPPTLSEAVGDLGSIIDLPDLDQVSRASPQVTFHALQEWEGYVLEKRTEEFTARLFDVTAGSLQEEEEAVIPLCEISEDDLKRLRPGSIFRWVIGYARSASGTKQRVSQIVFRDLPAMTKQDISRGKEWARKIAQSIVD